MDKSIEVEQRDAPGPRSYSPPSGETPDANSAEAAHFIAERGMISEGASVLVRFIAQVALDLPSFGGRLIYATSAAYATLASLSTSL